MAHIYHSLHLHPKIGPYLPPDWLHVADHHVATFSPTGLMTAPISFILDFAYAVEDDFHVGLGHDSGCRRQLPWALERTGFDANNAPVWRFDFQRYGMLDSMSLGDPRPTRHTLRDLNHLIIRQSASEIILLCGARACSVATDGASRDIRQSHRYLTLRCGYQLEFFVSQDDGHIPSRLYIFCPEIPANIHSISMSKALMLSELFKFVSNTR
ncbi:hypothetical protein J3459_011449 [Metarhizium acridum]|nr:hypothetical protein J3459_011449 [Metarhizium acridum]